MRVLLKKTCFLCCCFFFAKNFQTLSHFTIFGSWIDSCLDHPVGIPWEAIFKAQGSEIEGKLIPTNGLKSHVGAVPSYGGSKWNVVWVWMRGEKWEAKGYFDKWEITLVEDMLNMSSWKCEGMIGKVINSRVWNEYRGFQISVSVTARLMILSLQWRIQRIAHLVLYDTIHEGSHTWNADGMMF